MLFYEKWLDKLKTLLGKSSSVPESLRSKISTGYPPNHLYDIRDGKLIPYARLASRHKQIQKLYPKTLTSFLDLSCCKGYFVFDASSKQSMRNLGIDIFTPDLETCEIVKQTIGNQSTQFSCLKLEQLAQNVDNFGGAFQTVLLINTYQYLFFGSDRDPAALLDHDKIFKDIRSVCSHRFIFNNRTELKDCSPEIKQRAKALSAEKDYHSAAILEAAQKYFTLISSSTLGRYPLWLFEAK